LLDIVRTCCLLEIFKRYLGIISFCLPTSHLHRTGFSQGLCRVFSESSLDGTTVALRIYSIDTVVPSRDMLRNQRGVVQCTTRTCNYLIFYCNWHYFSQTKFAAPLDYLT